jgi:hypothetical protein
VALGLANLQRLRAVVDATGVKTIVSFVLRWCNTELFCRRAVESLLDGLAAEFRNQARSWKAELVGSCGRCSFADLPRPLGLASPEYNSPWAVTEFGDRGQHAVF